MSKAGLYCWLCCCCGCCKAFARPASRAQTLLEDAVNRSDLYSVLQLLKRNAADIDLERRLDFSSDFDLGLLFIGACGARGRVR